MKLESIEIIKRFSFSFFFGVLYYSPKKHIRAYKDICEHFFFHLKPLY